MLCVCSRKKNTISLENDKKYVFFWVSRATWKVAKLAMISTVVCAHTCKRQRAVCDVWETKDKIMRNDNVEKRRNSYRFAWFLRNFWNSILLKFNRHLLRFSLCFRIMHKKPDDHQFHLIEWRKGKNCLMTHPLIYKSERAEASHFLRMIQAKVNTQPTPETWTEPIPIIEPIINSSDSIKGETLRLSFWIFDSSSS